MHGYAKESERIVTDGLFYQITYHSNKQIQNNVDTSNGVKWLYMYLFCFCYHRRKVNQIKPTQQQQQQKYVSNKDWDTNSLHFVSDSNLQEKLVQ